MYFLYVLKSLVKNWHYIGITGNIEKRLFAHNAGKNKSTKARRPFRVIYIEKFPDRILAREREVYLKNTAKAREEIYNKYGAIV